MPSYQSLPTPLRGLCFAAAALAAPLCLGQAQFDFTRVASTYELDPTGTFIPDDFVRSVLYNDQMALIAYNSPAAEWSLYTGSPDNLTLAAKTGDPTLSGETLRTMAGVWMDGSGTAFLGATDQTASMFRLGDAGIESLLVTYPSQSMPGAPEGSRLARRANAYANGLTLIGGQNVGIPFTPAKAGLYADDGTGIRVIFDQYTVIPGAIGPISDIIAIQTDGINKVLTLGGVLNPNGPEGFRLLIESDLQNNTHQATDIDTLFGSIGYTNTTIEANIGIDEFGVVITAESGSRSGVFRFANGQITKLIDRNTLTPDGSTTFSNLNWGAAADAGNVLFSASAGGGGVGLYRTFNGGVVEIIKGGSQLDGKTVEFVFVSDRGLAGDNAGFTVQFNDGTRAIYHAQVVRGSDILVPVQSAQSASNIEYFDQVYDGAWIDVQFENQFTLQAQNTTPPAPAQLRTGPDDDAPQPASTTPGFTGIQLPDGYGSAIEVWVGDQMLGTFDSADTIDFAAYGYEMVENLRLVGMTRPNNAVGPLGVPLRVFGQADAFSAYGLFAGDANADQIIDATDIDLLFASFGQRPELDLTGDGLVDESDIDYLLDQLLNATYGDANLDGNIDQFDLDTILGNFGTAAGWASGDFNGDGLIDATDLNIALRNYTSNPDDANIPEPTSLALLTLGGLLIARRRRH